MLIVRVESKSECGARAAGIWEGVIAQKHESRALTTLEAFANVPTLQGEILGLRLKSDDERWLDVEGPMLGCELNSSKDTHHAVVRFAADRWRTW
jgi:hypothetical protein